MEEQTNEFAINTQEIYYQLRDQYDNFSVELLIEFRNRLEDILIQHDKVSSEFHPSNWRYFRQKYIRWFDEKWRKTKEKDKFQVFRLTYFMHDNVRRKRISINSLTDDEKIQIVAPLRAETSDQEQRPSIMISRAKRYDIEKILSPLQNMMLLKASSYSAYELLKTLKSHKTLIFEDLSQEERQEILDRLCPPSTPIPTDAFNGLAGMFNGNRRLINVYNNNDPYDWWRWEYDIYTLDMSCELNIDSDREDFEYFFAWQLALTDLYKVKPFLNWHFLNTFRGKADDFKDFIEILLLKYDKIQLDKHIKDIVNRHLASFNDIPDLKEIVIENNSKKQKLEIPIKLIRKFGDDYTCLTVAQTAILFEYLSESNAILSHEEQREFLAKENKSKAVQILSGYAYGSISDAIEANVKKKDMREIRQVKKIIEKIKWLIDNDLK